MKPLFKKETISVINNLNFKRWIFVDSNQMEQVFINLFTNSIFALENHEKKQITISTEAKEKRFFIKISRNIMNT